MRPGIGRRGISAKATALARQFAAGSLRKFLPDSALPHPGIFSRSDHERVRNSHFIIFFIDILFINMIKCGNRKFTLKRRNAAWKR
ncbi:MAG: hypothetical protein C6W56_04425 [Caldibacillus debilis]|nr:hypothetical protein [Bacillaceae bacterium]REJ30094.1 MAG: hypothetical protein C6W56_04425 [Caldibacillus debilis]